MSGGSSGSEVVYLIYFHFIVYLMMALFIRLLFFPLFCVVFCLSPHSYFLPHPYPLLCPPHSSILTLSFIISPYPAPEVEYTSKGLGGTYGLPADCWSLGAVLYVMLVARFPEFEQDNTGENNHGQRKLESEIVLELRLQRCNHL